MPPSRNSRLHVGNACLEVSFLGSIHIHGYGSGNVACCVVLSLSYVEDGGALCVQKPCRILSGNILHGYVLSRSHDLRCGFLSCRSAGLHIVGIGLGPGSHAALQGVNLRHVVADGGEDIGGSLCILLAGVADDDKIVVKSVGSSLHGSDACLEVTLLGSVHICGDSSRNMSGLVVCSFADIEEGVAVSSNIGFCVLNADVLHGYVLSRSHDLCCGFCLFSSSLGFLSGSLCLSSGLGSGGCCGGGLSGISSAGGHHACQQGCTEENSDSFFHDTFLP